MDYIGLIIGAFILASGMLLGYLFSPRKPKQTAQQTPAIPIVQGNLQKFGESGFLDVPLAKINKITHDTYIFTYELPDPDLPLGLHVGQHIAIHAQIPTKEFPEGELVKRKYTPISRVDQKGTFELLIKVYRRNTHPKFPEGGVLSQYLESMKVGDKMRISGPIGRLSYHGCGNTNIKKEEEIFNCKVKHFGLICGGTGIAPMYQVIKCILDNPADQTKVNILFANKTVDDILIREELLALEADPRFKLYFTLDTGHQDWKGFTGYVTKEMIKETMPAPGADTLICTCGPGPMNRMLKDQLAELGYDEDKVFKF